jgi:hypothetical protein
MEDGGCGGDQILGGDGQQRPSPGLRSSSCLVLVEDNKKINAEQVFPKNFAANMGYCEP